MRLTRHQPLIQIFSVTLSLFASSPLWAGGGAGARGGGTGLLCEGEAFARTLEEYEIAKSGQALSIPEARDEVEFWLREKLSKNSDLLDSTIQIWKSFGAYESWPRFDSQTAALSSDPEAQDYWVSLEISKLWKRLGLNVSNDLALVHDDFSEIPPGCRKVQLSLLRSGSPERVHEGALSARTQRILELHEALYRVGMDAYSHRLPIRTRRLIGALNGNAASMLKGAIREFTRKPRERRFYEGLNEVLLRKGSGGEKNGSCPMVLSFAYDGEVQRVIALSAQWGEGFPRAVTGLRVTRHAPLPIRKTPVRDALIDGRIMAWDRSPGLVFTEDDQAWLPGTTAVLFQRDRTYGLPYRDRGGVHYFNLSIYDSKKVVRTASDRSIKLARFAHYEEEFAYCSYESIDFGKKFDSDHWVKIWNQLLLNRVEP